LQILPLQPRDPVIAKLSLVGNILRNRVIFADQKSCFAFTLREHG